MNILKLHYPEEREELPKEDAWAIDAKNGVFAVADGVHLFRGIEYKNRYPRPSPAGKLAQKFCDVFVKTARHGSLEGAFRTANRSTFVFNKNRDKYSVFEKASAYYAATAAFMRFRGRYLEYGNICDAGVTAISVEGKLLFWSGDHRHHHLFDLSKYKETDATYLLRTIFRNAIGPRKEKMGYGVVTGERAAETYVRYGRKKATRDSVYVIATDGFEEYLQNVSFRKALLTLDKRKVEKAMSTIKKHHQGEAGLVSERTLVAAKFQ